MNKPAYKLVEEFGKVVSEVKAALNLPNLNYLYGYLSEIRETLAQDSKAGGSFAAGKYPLVWLVQPFTITKGDFGIYGTANNVRILIINATDKNWKAYQREQFNYKPIIDPIAQQLQLQINKHKAFYNVGTESLKLKETDRYFWGENQQQTTIDDFFDCKELSEMTIKIKNNINCP